jgi:hypothetical protein
MEISQQRYLLECEITQLIAYSVSSFSFSKTILFFLMNCEHAKKN